MPVEGRKQKLVIVGDSVYAHVAYEYFSHDSDYEVVCFSVEREFLKESQLFGLPVVSFDELEGCYPPSSHSLFVAVVFTQFNRLRARLGESAKARGYQLASYTSSWAQIAQSAQIGEHCFICEDVVVQPYATVGENSVLWSGVQVSSFCTTGSGCFFLPNTILFGFATVGQNCVIGANVALETRCHIGDDCYVGPGRLITEDIRDGVVLDDNPIEAAATLQRQLQRVDQ